MDYFSAYQRMLESRARDNEIKDLQRNLKKYYDSSKHYELLCLKLKSSNHPAQEFVKRQELEIRNLTQVAHMRTLEINNLKQTAEEQSLEITILMGAVSVLTETKTQQLLDIAQLKETAATQSRKIMELTKTAAAQRRSITELTEPIFHSVSTPTKYDDYFTAKFASLAGDIRQWVFRYFRGGPDVQHQDLPLAAQKCMRAVILGYDASLGTTVSAKEIEAAVTQRLSQHIFNRPYVFELCGSSYPLIFDLIGGSRDEKRDLHARTVDLLMKNDWFKNSLHESILLVANDIRGCFDNLGRVGSEEQRRIALHKIVEKTARLGLETYRQASDFQLERITIPSMACGRQIKHS